MEIRNLSQEEEQKVCRLRDMIVLALSGDGILSAEEELCIKTVMTMKSIKLDYVELVLSDPFAIKDSYPTTHKEKLEYLADIVQLMMSDNKCPIKEIKYCEAISDRLGLSRDDLSTCVEAWSFDYPKAADDYVANGGIIVR